MNTDFAGLLRTFLDPSALAALPLRESPGESGVTLRSLVENIPTDPATLFVYALIVGSLYVTWRGSRRRPGAPRSGSGRPA